MSMQPIRHLLPYTENQEDGSNIMYIRIEPALLYLEAGQTSKIKVYAVLTDGRNEEITHKVKWQSQHTTIGKVNEEGTITAVEPGNMSIVAEFEQHKAELIVAIDKKAKAAAKREKKDGGKFGKVGVLTVAATLFVATGVYGAVQIFTSDEAASGTVSEPAAISAASGSENAQQISKEVTISPDAEKAEEVTSGTPGESAGEEALKLVGEEKGTTMEESQLPADQPATAPAVLDTAGTAATEPANTGAMLGALQSLLATQKTGSTPATAVQTPPASPVTVPTAGGQAAANSTQSTTAKPQAVPVKNTTAATTAAKPKQPVQTNKQPTTTRTTAPVQKQPVKTVAPAATSPKTVATSTTTPATVAAQPKPPATTSVMLVPVEKAGKWGYKRAGEDEVTIPYNFDHATKFSDGLALVKKDGKFGYINAKGQVVIPFEYSYATSFSGGMATVKKDGKLGTIDKTGSFRSN